MPRQIPNSLAEVPPEEPSEPQINDTADVAGQLPAVPDDVLRVLGGIGLPGDAPIERIEAAEVPAELSITDPMAIGPEPTPVVVITYSAQQGLDIARQRNRNNGFQSAIDVLSETEQTAETDAYHDELVLSGVRSYQRNNGERTARDFLDKIGLRTSSARSEANESYDASIITEARSIIRNNGLDSGLNYIAAAVPRLAATKPNLDELYDETIINAAKSRYRNNGKQTALDYLTQSTPKTVEGIQAIEKLRQEIQG